MPGFSFRRLIGGVPLGYRLRRRWQWSRPLSLPQYIAGTPFIDGTGPKDFFLPPNPATLAVAAQEATRPVEEILARLTQTDQIADAQLYYRSARDKFGERWRYADILTVLWAAATLGSPKTYLEIGVRTGRSAAVVGAISPSCDIYGFDIWTEGYGGYDNPGPDFVRDELRSVGHTGSVTLVSGDSSKTLGPFLAKRPDLYFDLIAIDGDKSIRVASSDFANALPRLKVGGIIVCDDIFLVPHLERIWHDVIRRDARYVHWQFAEGAVGIVAAIRMSDGPLHARDF